jgi:hypothetical protein
MFYFAKMLPLVLLVALAEWYSRRNPIFVKKAMRFCVGAYVAFYFLSVILINMH